MATEVKMPRLSLTMESGLLLKWLKTVGDFVEKGEGLAEIETDKATAVLEAPARGYIRKLLAEEGTERPCDATVVILTATQDEAYESPREAQGLRETIASAPKPSPLPHGSAGMGTQIHASPAAKHRAKQLGIDLATVIGTGPKGRIGLDDVQRAADEQERTRPVMGPSSPLTSAPATTRSVPLTKTRATIARRMVESATTIPQFSVRRRVDMSGSLRFLGTSTNSSARQTQPKSSPGVADIIHFVVSRALCKHPEVNASFEPGGTIETSRIVQHEAVNLGIAVVMPEGLIVPVIHGADRMSLEDLTQERIRLQEEAQIGRLPARAFAQGTFTVSNLGTLGVDDFTAMVNPPEAAILALGRMQDASAVRNGATYLVPMMTLSVTADHRILDGFQVARFLQTLSEYLADPGALIE